MSVISSYSDWMSQLPAELHNIPLFNLAIPGKQVKLHLLSRNNTRHSSIDCKFAQFLLSEVYIWEDNVKHSNFGLLTNLINIVQLANNVYQLLAL